jgi:hypothetical protein
MSPAKKSGGRGPRPARSAKPAARRGAGAATARRGAAKRARAAKPARAARTRAAAPRPALSVVAGRPRKGPPRVAPPPAFPQTAGASDKQRVLFRLVRARAQVLAAVQGLVVGAAAQPLGVGKWTAREVVLHLACRDRARLREFEPALRGVPVSWQDLDEAEMAVVNARELAGVSHLAWDEALRLLLSTRESLMEALDDVPEEPADVWEPGHAFGWMLDVLPKHDEHHARQIKNWRAEAGL